MSDRRCEICDVDILQFLINSVRFYRTEFFLVSCQVLAISL